MFQPTCFSPSYFQFCHTLLWFWRLRRILKTHGFVFSTFLLASISFPVYCQSLPFWSWVGTSSQQRQWWLLSLGLFIINLVCFLDLNHCLYVTTLQISSFYSNFQQCVCDTLYYVEFHTNPSIFFLWHLFALTEPLCSFSSSFNDVKIHQIELHLFAFLSFTAQGSDVLSYCYKSISFSIFSSALFRAHFEPSYLFSPQ